MTVHCAEPRCTARATVEVTEDGRARQVCFTHYNATVKRGHMDDARMLRRAS